MTFDEFTIAIGRLNPSIFFKRMINSDDPIASNTIYASVTDSRLIVPDGFIYDEANSSIIPPANSGLGVIGVKNIFQEGLKISNKVFAYKLYQLNEEIIICAQPNNNEILINQDLHDLSLPYNYYLTEDGNITNGIETYNMITYEMILSQLAELNPEVTFGIIKREYNKLTYGAFIYSTVPGEYLKYPYDLKYERSIGISNGIKPLTEDGDRNISGLSIGVVSLAKCDNYDIIDVYNNLDIIANISPRF